MIRSWLFLSAVCLTVVVAGCASTTTSIGTGPMAVTPSAKATPSPSPAPTATASAGATGSQTAVGASPAAFSTSSPYGLQLTFPATESGTATLDIVTTTARPSGEPVIQSRRPATIGAMGIMPLAYVTLTASAAVSFTTTPSFTIPQLSQISTTSGASYYLGYYDTSAPSSGWVFAAGPGTVSGSGSTQSVAFAPTDFAYSFVPGRSYTFALYATASPQSTPFPVARFSTGVGNMDVTLRPDVAPTTVANFLHYADSGRYTNQIFHRLVSGFVIQGGGYVLQSGNVQAIAAYAPIANEAQLPNTAGTIAMAYPGNEPNSATSQFFFNLVDNSSELDGPPDGPNAVFGAIASGDSASLQTLAALGALMTYDDSASFGSAFADLPVENDPTDAAPDASQFVVIGLQINPAP